MIEIIVGIVTVVSSVVTTMHGFGRVQETLTTQIQSLKLEITALKEEFDRAHAEHRSDSMALRERMARAEARLELLEAKR